MIVINISGFITGLSLKMFHILIGQVRVLVVCDTVRRTLLNFCCELCVYLT